MMHITKYLAIIISGAICSIKIFLTLAAAKVFLELTAPCTVYVLAEIMKSIDL